MAEIYRKAENVLVWLGPAYQDSDIAMQVLSNKKIPNNLWSTRAAYGIRCLCQRSYWTRLWVVQELTLAKSISVLCGSKVVAWSRLESLLTAALEMPALRTTTQADIERQALRSSAAIAMIDQLRRRRELPQLYHQILAFRHLRSAEPRDKVFALLGVVAEGHEDIRPDYRIVLRMLLHNVLRNHHKRQPPDRLEDVVDQCNALAALMDLHPGALLDFSDNCVESEIPPEEALGLYSVHVDGNLPSPNGLFLLYWWAYAHNHVHVLSLWRSRFGNDAIQDAFLSNIRLGNPAMVKLMLSSGMLNAVSRPEAELGVWRSFVEAEDDGSTAYIWRVEQVGVLLTAIHNRQYDIAKTVLDRNQLSDEEVDAYIRYCSERGLNTAWLDFLRTPSDAPVDFSRLGHIVHSNDMPCRIDEGLRRDSAQDRTEFFELNHS